MAEMRSLMTVQLKVWEKIDLWAGSSLTWSRGYMHRGNHN